MLIHVTCGKTVTGTTTGGTVHRDLRGRDTRLRGGLSGMLKAGWCLRDRVGGAALTVIYLLKYATLDLSTRRTRGGRLRRVGMGFSGMPSKLTGCCDNCCCCGNGRVCGVHGCLVCANGHVGTLAVGPDNDSCTFVSDGGSGGAMSMFDLVAGSRRLNGVAAGGRFGPLTVYCSPGTGFLCIVKSSSGVRVFRAHGAHRIGDFTVGRPTAHLSTDPGKFFLVTDAGSGLRIVGLRGRAIHAALPLGTSFGSMTFSDGDGRVTILATSKAYSMCSAGAFAIDGRFSTVNVTREYFFRPRGGCLTVMANSRHITFVGLLGRSSHRCISTGRNKVGCVGFSGGIGGSVCLMRGCADKVIFAPMKFLDPGHRRGLGGRLGDHVSR